MSDIVSRRAAAGGIRLHYLRSNIGSTSGGSGLPLLLLHGWPEWSHAWRPVMTRLAGRFDMVAPDFRGFGRSQKTSPQPAEDATPAILAADIVALADRLGLARFGIVSHDMGSMVAQAIARQHPGRVAGLYFFNCVYAGIGARFAQPSHLGEIWYQQFHQKPWAAALVGSSRKACRIYLQAFLTHWSHRKDTFDGELEAWVDNFMRPGNLQGGFNWYRSVHAARMAMIEGRAEPLPPIGIRTRVLWGAHDPVLKACWTDRLHEHFGELQLDLAPDAGHFVHMECPELAAQDIARFFRNGHDCEVAISAEKGRVKRYATAGLQSIVERWR
jgi:pimeloyl-ACP methyl ester carboxylesterase